MGFDGTARCFFQTGAVAAKTAASLKLAGSAQILTPSPIAGPECQGLEKIKLTLKEALSRDFALHTGDNLVLIYSRTLWLSVPETTYYRAGMEMKKLKNRYHAKLDLTKTNKRLDQSYLLEQKLEFLVPASSAHATTQVRTVTTPPFKVPEEDFDDWAPHFYEWVSLVGLNSPVVDPSISDQNPALCNYFDFPGSRQSIVHCTTIKGLITPEYIEALLAQGHEWIIITVQGLPDSPMAWDKPHHSGSHGYTVLKHSDYQCLFKLVSRDDL